jgi:predicted DNA-binding transcriptional regulator YafY
MQKDLMKKSKEMKRIYEDIIHIFALNEGRISTNDLQLELETSYKYTKDVRTTVNYLKRLGAGAVEGVKFTWVPKGQHILEDLRELDRKDVLEYFEKKESKHQKKIASKKVIYGEEKAYMRLAMESIRKLDTLSEKHHREIEKRLGLSGMNESPYFIDNEDMESVDMSDPDILYLKEAITHDAITEFRYTGKSSKEWYVVEPYKLIIFDGLWYLFGKDCDDTRQPYKTWRLIHIKDVDYEKDGTLKHTMDDKDTENLLKYADDAQFKVCTEENKPHIKRDITVKLKIYPEVIHLFDHEAHIPGAVSEPTAESDGSLILTTKVNTYNDIRAEIKSWLPHIEILEPKELREELLMKVEEYRDRFKDEIERIKEKSNAKV